MSKHEYKNKTRAEYCKQYRDLKISLGLCGICKEPQAEGTHFCTKHLAAFRRKSAHQKSMRMEFSLCRSCGYHRDNPRFKTCDHCRKVNAERVRRVRAKAKLTVNSLKTIDLPLST